MSENDYKVGYGKPPRHTRFKPGQSGNPAGRPKGTKNLATDLQEELAEIIMVNEGGESKPLSKQRALLKALVARAMKGETRAADVLIKLVVAIEQAANRSGAQTAPMSEEDRAVLDAYTQRVKNALVGQQGGKVDE